MQFDNLKGVVPESVLNEIRAFKDLTPLRAAHFLAQCDHESRGFNYKYEILNYTKKRLLQVFPRYFDSASAASYERNPEKIGSRVYANRMGNGDEKSGDGFTFRGRGYLMLTGRANYQHFADFVGVDVVIRPELVEKRYPLTSAYWFFQDNNLWKFCDVGSSREAVIGVTKRVNGGINGLEDRLALFKKYAGLLGVANG